MRNMNIPLFKIVSLRRRLLAACFVIGIAAFSQTARSTPTYATAVLADNPVAFWQLNETSDPSSGTLPAADSSGMGLNGTYGATSRNAFNGIVAPQASAGYQGFAVGQGALYCGAGDATSPVTLPALNLNTNAVTIAMWINPAGGIGTFTGLLMNRTTGDTEGFGFGGTQDANGMAELGYTWNTNSAATYNFNSGLYPVAGIWQLAALVIQSNSASIYLYYTNINTGALVLSSAVNAIAHTPAAFASGTTLLGSDVNGAAADSGRVFGGSIAGVAVYKSALTQDQILSLFAAGVGVSGFPPSITGQPKSAMVTTGSQVQLSATGIGGTSPFTYQWKLNGTNISLLADSANFTGANSNILTILSATANDVGSYQLFITNSIGGVASSNAIVTTHAPQLVGKWFTNNTLLDVSGYQPPGTHDGYDALSTGNYTFTNDVPPGKSGHAVWLFNGDTTIAIHNSSTLDAAYTNTFDDGINNAMTIALWAKGWPTGWNPFASKYGETTPAPAGGWQIRQAGDSGQEPCWTIRGSGGALTLGRLAYNNPADLVGAGVTLQGDTNNWHLYVGTFDAATGIRNMYVDGVLRGSENSNSVYTLSRASYLCFGGRDNGGNVFVGLFNGLIYDARVYNYAISASDVQDLYGVIPPAIANQPTPAAVFAGSKATFTVTASGTPPLDYQWQLNGTNVNLLLDATNFTGVTSNVLAILSVSTNDVGLYHVIVTSRSGYGNVTSTNAALSIVPKVMLGQWFTNGTLTDLSGHTPPGTHDAYAIGGGNYAFTNDLPPGIIGGQSIQFTSTDSGMAIANSATSDGAYTNTFDTSALSVAFWAKDRGPGGASWLAWVAKDGYNNNGEYNGIGWSVGTEAWSQFLYFDMEGIDRGGIAYTLGDGLWGNGILQCSPQNLPGDNTTWHHYATTFNPETGVRRTYFDGTLAAEQTGCAPYAKAPDKHLTIAAQEQTLTGFTGFHRGFMYDVRFYNYPLTPSEVAAIPPDPVIISQPLPTLNAYVGVTEQLKTTVLTHSTPVTNHWQLNGTNLVDGAFGGATISGANTSTLTLANVTTNLQGVYRLIVSDPAGITISSNAVVTVLQTAPVASTNLVGEWVAGETNLTDTSGYSPAGTHDGRGVSGAGVPSFGYGFTNDVPPGVAGHSLTLIGNTVIAITNSSDLDGAYTNTFDDTINTNGMTVMCWTKGLPGGWNPWLSKWGESGVGWQLRVNGDGGTACWTIRGPGGDDMSSTIGKSDGKWHHYAGTYSPITGDRALYVDGVLAATLTGQGAINPTTSSHLVIGGRDSGGNTFGQYFTGEIYGVRIYNAVLSEAQINHLLIPKVVALPVINPPIHNGNQLILSWSSGTLQQATNLLGPWTATGATSPYTNDMTTNAPRMFYRVSIP
jgi:hypothetical protein